MAVYRLHKKLWDKGLRPSNKGQEVPGPFSNRSINQKRKRGEDTLDNAKGEGDLEAIRKLRGVSSGLSVIVNRQKGGQKSKEVLSGSKGRKEKITAAEDSDWWTKL